MSEFLSIQLISEDDNPVIKKIIQTVMPEFGADGPGFAIHDVEVKDMFAAYQKPRSCYFVVVLNGKVVGGAGIAPLEGASSDICELKKMYFLKKARGQGIGEIIVERCLEAAEEFGFKKCYLETLSGMDAAQKLYRKLGFEPLKAPLGKTGHFSCDKWYLKNLP